MRQEIRDLETGDKKQETESSAVSRVSPAPVSPSEVPALEVHDVTVAYHRRPVLWDVDFALPAGNLIAIVGPNGAGKSTLLKAVMGLLPLASGWIKIHGKPFHQQRQIIGYVPQRESVDWDFP